jgi:hypothetical protein
LGWPARESGVPFALFRRPVLRLTKPWRSRTAWTVLIAGAMHIRIEPGQPLPDLRRAPVRLVLLQSDDLRLDLEGQLIGVAMHLACDVIERRLAALETEMGTPGPSSLSRKDNGYGPVPVQGGWQSPVDPRD